MAVHHLDELLAQTDPFDLAQAIERYVCTLDGATVRALLRDGIAKGGSYYRTELTQVLERGPNDAALQRAFIRFLQSNLRAVNLFGPAFASAILDQCPAYRMVGIGEERHSLKNRTTVIAGAVAALVLLGAGAEHAIVTARAAAQVPQPTAQAAAVAMVLPSVPPISPRAVAARTRRRPAVRLRPVQPAPVRVAIAPQAAPPTQAPQPSIEAPPPQPTPGPALLRSGHRRAKTPPPGAATLTIKATAPPTPLDAVDMPDSYTDSTPLPSESAQPAQVAGDPSVPTPTPSPTPKPHSWLHRTLMHFNPFQPGAHIRIP